MSFASIISSATGAIQVTQAAAPAAGAIAAAKAATKSPATISFPSDIGDFFMSFNFYDYRTLNTLNAAGSTTTDLELTRSLFNANKQSVQSAIATSSFGKICLPIPSNLVDSFRVDYANLSTGLWGSVANIVLNDASKAGSAVASLFSSQISNTAVVGSLGASQIQGLGAQINGSPEAQLAARIALMGIDTVAPGASSLIDMSLGVAENPNLVVVFKGPTLKQHNFSWRLVARTAAEGTALKNIIGTIKRAMHPQKINDTSISFLKYPAECLAQFNAPTSNFLYPLRPCVVEDFSVNYGPNGVPSFYQGTNDAVTVEISMRLQETSYYVREDFSDSTVYGSDGLTATPGTA